MMKNVLLAALLAAPASALAQQSLPISFQPEPGFERIVHETIRSMQPADPFTALEACLVADARPVQRFTLEQAEQLLVPCMRAVSARYGRAVAARRATIQNPEGFSTQVEVLALETPADVEITSELWRDLSHGLRQRQSKLLGHPVVLRKQERPADEGRSAAVQAALDGCALIAQVRPVETSADFISYYGGCLRRSSLKVSALAPWTGRQLGVLMVTDAGTDQLSSLSGWVEVNNDGRAVRVQVLAYPAQIYRP